LTRVSSPLRPKEAEAKQVEAKQVETKQVEAKPEPTLFLISSMSFLGMEVVGEGASLVVEGTVED
jgi:hypothetical protein